MPSIQRFVVYRLDGAGIASVAVAACAASLLRSDEVTEQCRWERGDAEGSSDYGRGTRRGTGSFYRLPGSRLGAAEIAQGERAWLDVARSADRTPFPPWRQATSVTCLRRTGESARWRNLHERAGRRLGLMRPSPGGIDAAVACEGAQTTGRTGAEPGWRHTTARFADARATAGAVAMRRRVAPSLQAGSRWRRAWPARRR